MTSRSWYGTGPILGTPSEWGYYAWPDWACVSVEELYATAPFDMPSTGVCCSAHSDVAIPDRPPVGPAYRAFCPDCVRISRERQRPRRPHFRRDHGLCLTCGEPAKLNGNAYQGMVIVLARLELVGGTLAAYCSTRFCYMCDSTSPRCRSRVCAWEGRGRHAALPRGCCWRTRHALDTVHCREACAHLREQNRAGSARWRSSNRVVMCGTQKWTSPLCRSRACREAGRGLHPGNTQCCARAKRSPHCAVECARRRAVNDAGNRRRDGRSSPAGS